MNSHDDEQGESDLVSVIIIDDSGVWWCLMSVFKGVSKMGRTPLVFGGVWWCPNT